MSASAYLLLLARALAPLRMTRQQLEWDISLAEGHAHIHTDCVLRGHAMIWPQIEATVMGRRWQRLEDRIRAARDTGGRLDGEANEKAVQPRERE